MVIFYWSLNASKSHVSRTLLSILAYVKNAVVRIISILPLISNSSSLPPPKVFPSILITIGNTITHVMEVPMV